MKTPPIGTRVPNYVCIASLNFDKNKMQSKSKLKILLLALVVLIISIYYKYISCHVWGESFSKTHQQPVKMTNLFGASCNNTKNRNLTSSPGDISGYEHVVCGNLSHVSISHMRAVSAQWQQVKENVTCHFYSAFWETRMPLQEVRVIGMSHRDLIEDEIWCQLWYEGQGHPLTVKAIKLHKCRPNKCKT